MTKSEILKDLRLDELIGTPFEDMMEIVSYKAGDMIFYGLDKYVTAQYVVEGNLQYIIYTPDGGEFYSELFPGEIAGVNIAIANADEETLTRQFEADVVVKEDTTVVKLPFEKLLKNDFPGKSEVLVKLMIMAASENMRRSKYFIYKVVNSDEEFFLKALESNRLKKSNTREIAQLLNINLRTLQRIIKNLVDKKVIVREKGSLRIASEEALERYKKKFDK